ncbi:MAG: Ig-like domain-containing protein, partial [Armatimonadota bacterium]
MRQDLVSRRKRRAGVLFVAALFAAVGGVAGAKSMRFASVTTDQPDYYPGDTVVISGQGWESGETVDLHIETSCHCDHDAWNGQSIANGDGDFENRDFVVQEEHLGVTFTLTATGESSGLVATHVFTDSPKLDNISPITQTSAVTAGTGGPAGFSFKINRLPPPPGGIVNNVALSISGLPSGVSVSGLATPVTVGGTGYSGTFTLAVPSTLAKGSYSFSMLADGPGNDDATGGGILVVGNSAPTANAQSVSTDEDSAKAITLTGSDTDGDSLAYSIVGAPAHGTLSGSAPNVTYTPDPNYNGPDSFTFKVNDGSSDSNVATVSITVNPVNDAPTADDDTSSTDEDTSVDIDALDGDVDVDGDTLSIQSVNDPAHGSASIVAGKVRYTPDADWNGTESFDYTVSDGNGGTDTGTITVTVNPVNDAPTADSQSVATDEDTVKDIDLVAHDIDGDSLEYSIVNPPAHGTLTLLGATATYTPSANYNGPDSFTFKVNDGTVDSNIATVSITVNPVNDNPVADDDTASTNEDLSVDIDVLDGDVDVDGDTLSIQSVNDPAHGSASIVAGKVRYTPDANWNGTETFDYTVSDGNGGTDTGTITVTVAPVNDAPIVTVTSGNNQTVDYSDPVAPIVIRAVDVDGDLADFALTPLPLPAGLSASVVDDGNARIWTITGWVGAKAGTYGIKVKDASLISLAGATLVVDQEDATVNYVGDNAVTTAGPTITTAPVRLSANVAEIADGNSGDITKAKVRFKLYKSGNLSGTPDRIVETGVDGSGYASTIVTLDCDTWSVVTSVPTTTVGAFLGNEYWRSGCITDVVNVTLGTTERRTTGGGWISEPLSLNGKANFGFTVGYAKNSAPKGQSVFVIRGNDGYDYVVKS